MVEANMSLGETRRAQLDLRGEVCPYTFVRTKLALEELAVDDELEITLDHRPAWHSVPRALREEGQELLHVDPQPKLASPEAGAEGDSAAVFRIVVRKRPSTKRRPLI
jgi:TusA-related sulfurtransferase